MDIDDDMATDDRLAAVDSSHRKRRHQESSTAMPSKSSLEILQLVEHPNFEELARWNPMFQRAWNATRQAQKESNKTFSACVSQEFTIALTRALLKTHLDLSLPYLEDNHLCPPVPNRFFYLHWIHSELLQSIGGIRAGRFGMDIGSGATGIYSLLAAKFFQCHMFSTEIDERAASMAQRNADANHLTSHIHIAHVTPSHSQDPNQPPGGPLEHSLVALEQFLVQKQRPPTALDFVMTNPPFYDPSTNEHVNPRAGDGRARTAMTVSEGSYPGGEVGFVTEIIGDSLRGRRKSSRWFSSMLGKKASLVLLQKMLTHVLGPAHVRATEYGPGQYTRWFLAWTLERPSANASNARVPCHDNTDRFTVSVPTAPNIAIGVSEVVSRIVAFCESSPGGWKLTATTPMSPSNATTTTTTTTTTTACVQIQETNPLPISLFVDESDPYAEQMAIPSSILDALQGQDNSYLLPLEGHFVITISVEAIGFNSTTGECHVGVHLIGYRHSSRGHAAIKKISSTIQGDVCRTNRYWRRKLQRRQEQG